MARHKGPKPTRSNVPTGPYVKFGDLVRNSRISFGYTQTDLGKIVGISKQSILHIEQGVFPNGKILVKLICILHLDPFKLREIIWEEDYFAVNAGGKESRNTDEENQVYYSDTQG